MKNKEFNPEAITLPEELKNRQFLSYKEFGLLVGVSEVTIRTWARRGIIKTRQFTPRCNRVPMTEIDRLKRGELMEGC